MQAADDAVRCEHAALPRPNLPRRDPLLWIDRIHTKTHTLWLERMYPFQHFGRHVSIHHTCEIDRAYSPSIAIADSVYLAPDVWLNVDSSCAGVAAISLGKGCKIGRR